MEMLDSAGQRLFYGELRPEGISLGKLANSRRTSPVGHPRRFCSPVPSSQFSSVPV